LRRFYARDSQLLYRQARPCQQLAAQLKEAAALPGFPGIGYSPTYGEFNRVILEFEVQDAAEFEAG